LFSNVEKTVKPSVQVQRKTEQAFFGNQNADKTATPVSAFFKPAIQPKLTVNQPNDAYEKEADLVAERVVSMPTPNVIAPIASAPDVQRQEEEQKEEEENTTISPTTVQRMSESGRQDSPTLQTKLIAWVQRAASSTESNAAEEEENLQTYSQIRSTSLYRSDVMQLSGRGPPVVGAQFQNQLHQSTHSGQPLSESVNHDMSTRFGADFSSVRVHTDAGAQQMSKQVNAHAFTYGNHIYFNSGKYEPESNAGKTLLAHELTHTIQQGASPVQSNVQRKHNFTAVQRKSIIQRDVAPQLTAAVALAEAEQGKVIANQAGPDGNRTGWERLMEYFTTTFGEDKIVSAPTGADGVVWKEHIKKKSELPGMVPNQPDPNVREKRDAMPSWCGIFAFWALNKAGIPMPKWQLGESIIKPEAAYPPGYTPQPGDLAYRDKRSHYGLVVGMDGGKVKSVNGNTAGEDNLGGEIQVQTHDLSSWTAFFNPMVAKEGNLRDPAKGDKDTVPKTLKELRKLKFQVSRKAESDSEEKEEIQTKSDAVNQKEEEEKIQAKSEPAATNKEEEKEEEKIQKKEELATPEEKEELQRKSDNKEEEKEEKIQRAEIGNSGGFASNGLEYDATENTPDIQTKPESSLAIQVRNKSPGQLIQGGWLDDAWDAVSGLASDVASFIEEGLDAAKDWLLGKVRDFVMEIPGYTLLSYILGYDPITGANVNKTPLTLLDAVLDIIPIGGAMVKWVLEYFQAINPVANWLFDSVKQFANLIASVESRFEDFWNRLSIDDCASPETVMNNVANLFQSIVSDIISFVEKVGGDFLTMVKDIAIKTLATFVQNHFPDAFDLLTVLLGENPVTKQKVDRNGTNILNAGLKVLGERGSQIKQQMIENGIFDKCVGWIDRSIQLVLSLISDVGNIFDTVWKLITFDSLFKPIDTFTEIANAFATPILRIVDFLKDAMIELLAILRKALTAALSKFARETRGYFLVTVLIGIDPFTQEIVPRNTENIIRGFFSLMDGGEEQFRQMKESGAIDKMTQKITKAVAQLKFTKEYIIGLFTSLWEALDWTDFLNPIGVFRTIVNTFADPIVRLVSFIITIIKIAVEVLLVVMSFPVDTVNNIIQKSLAVFGSIKKDPIGFLKNLLRGIKQGFIQFFDNILKHLMSGLANWLFGSLGSIGIQMPPDLSFKSILKLVLQILGISIEHIMERVWLKLTEQIGAEKVAKIKKAIDKLTGIWSFVKELIEKGPVAIVDLIAEKLSNLWTMVLDAAKGWIMDKVITQVTTKLLSLLDPTGIMAVINSVIAIYKAIQSFIEQLRAMLEILNNFVNGIAEIAAGNVKVAADYLEGAMARGIPVLIGFLANQLSLGDIGKKLAEIIGKIREKVTEGIDWLVAKALRLGRPIIDGVLRVIEFGEGLVERGRAAVASILQWWKKKKNFNGADGKPHKLFYKGSENNAVLTVASEETALTKFLEDAKKDNTDAAKTATISQAATLSQEADALKDKLKTEKDEVKQKKLNDDLEAKMGLLVPLVSALMGGNGKSVKILEVYLNTKVVDENKELLPAFKADIKSNKNKVDGKGNEVYGILNTENKGTKSVTIRRNGGMADAGFMSVYINKEGILMPGNEQKYTPDHKNYIPDKITVEEKNGTYTANYTTKTYDGNVGPTFKIEISFSKVLEGNKDVTQSRTVAAQNLVFKPEGNPRGVTDSAIGGFDNAHIIGDRFGGSGKNQSLNIYPSSPNYNRKVMLNVENAMAAVFSRKDKFNLTVSAQIKEENKSGSNLKGLLENEFKTDNPESKPTDEPIQKELSAKLQTEINKDIKQLPGQFMSVNYSSPGSFSDSISADSDYDKAVKEFESKNVNA
jgi:hypothetical protein